MTENQEVEAVGAFRVSPVSAGLVSQSPPSVSTVSGTSGAQGRCTTETSQGSKYTGKPKSTST